MMVAQWMLYSFLVALLLTGAAHALELWLRSAGRPVRWVWAGASLFSLFLPLVALLTGGRYPGLLVPLGVGRESWTGLFPFVVSSADAGAAEAAAGTGPFFLSNGVLSATWVVATVVAATWYAGVWRRLSRSSGSWRRVRMAGRVVYVSRHGGPAALGLFRPCIVVPEWLLGVSESAQRMVLLHEAEHVRSRDHALLAVFPLLLVLFPWNLPLWWQAGRLRLAVELDCDLRVLARGVDVEAYASLLLQIAARPRGHVLAAPLTRPDRRPLEARLRAMTRGPLRWPRVRASASVAVTVFILAVVCRAEPPLTPGAALANTEPSLNSLLVSVTGPGTDLAAEMESGRIQVFVDDERVDHARVAALRSEDIAAVEVRKGAFSQGGGDRLISGSIFIRTKTNSRLIPIEEIGSPDLRSAEDHEVRMAAMPGPESGSRVPGLLASGDPLERLPEDAEYLLDGRASSKQEIASLDGGRLARVEVFHEKQNGGPLTHRVRAYTKGGEGG